MKFPTLLTVFRIAAIPLLVLLIALQVSGLWLGILFGLVGLSDLFDGYLARRWGQTSQFGAFLDPVADKLVIVTVLAILIWQEQSLFFTLPALVMIGREVTISALREWMAEIGRRKSIAVSALGKTKTAFQFSALLAFLLLSADGRLFVDLGMLCGMLIDGCAVGERILLGLNIIAYSLLYTAMAMTLISMVHYLTAAWPWLDWDSSKQPY